MSCAIAVEQLKKSYGTHLVLNGLNFQVQKGEVFALLGVNGAGKTTTLECMEQLRAYDSGAIHVDGRMGIQLQSGSLPAHLRPREAIRLFALWNKASIDEAMLRALGIDTFAKQQYGELSTGQKRRLHLALALISDPDIVFLDEPTAGLDVEGRVSLHAEIHKLKARGKTIVLASHDMAEVETLCDRIAILNGGSIVFLGTVEELSATISNRYHISIKTAQGEQCIETDNVAETLLTVLQDYKQKGVAILDIKTDRGTLEQHFIDIARRDPL